MNAMPFTGYRSRDGALAALRARLARRRSGNRASPGRCGSCTASMPIWSKRRPPRLAAMAAMRRSRRRSVCARGERGGAAAALGDFCGRRRRARAGRLRLHRLSHYLALTLASARPRSIGSRDECVTHFDSFRAPLERGRPGRAARATFHRSALQHLEQFGYPRYLQPLPVPHHPRRTAAASGPRAGRGGAGARHRSPYARAVRGRAICACAATRGGAAVQGPEPPRAGQVMGVVDATGIEPVTPRRVKAMLCR